MTNSGTWKVSIEGNKSYLIWYMDLYECMRVPKLGV